MAYDPFNYRFSQRAPSIPSNTPDSEQYAIERLTLGPVGIEKREPNRRSKAMLKRWADKREKERAEREASAQNHSAKCG